MDRAGQLERRVRDGTFAITAEVVPPLSADPGDLLARAAPLKGLVDAVNVTDGAGARTAMSSLAAAAILAQAGIEPVLQFTCRDRNRIALAADLVGAAALGVKNLLIIHGDDPATGDQPDATAVFDLDSRQMMSLAQAMRDEGRLPPDREIATPPHFFIGCADSPHDPADDWKPNGLLAKIGAGAQFAQTQFCFDLGVAERYGARLAQAGVTDRLRFLYGVGPLASAKSARWMNENLFGVSIPEAIIDRLEGARDARAEGLRICIELIEGLSRLPHVDGVHVMAPTQGSGAIAEVLRGADIAR